MKEKISFKKIGKQSVQWRGRIFSRHKAVSLMEEDRNFKRHCVWSAKKGGKMLVVCVLPRPKVGGVTKFSHVKRKKKERGKFPFLFGLFPPPPTPLFPRNNLSPHKNGGGGGGGGLVPGWTTNRKQQVGPGWFPDRPP